jgi:hypothetical protein
MTRSMRITALDKQDLERSTVQAYSEWGFVAGAILVLLLVTSIPYLYAYLTTPIDKQFMGLSLNVPDHMQYFSWMRELTYSNLSANKLTPEPNAPIFFNLLWWGMARLSLLLRLDYVGIYQILQDCFYDLVFAALLPSMCLVPGRLAHAPDCFPRHCAYLGFRLGAGLDEIYPYLR